MQTMQLCNVNIIRQCDMATSSHLFIHWVDQDGIQGVGAGHQVGVCAAGIIKQLPEDDAVDHCRDVEYGEGAAVACVCWWWAQSNKDFAPKTLGQAITHAGSRSGHLPH